ncbi:hypothetical protein [Haloechinothrix sp. LS1_15]|uniref:hypothetical protein n=1 Tax=Haloechinothrix sp. LS1_15 TaxID=2652248 RepID=UPI00294712A9|nr:hypothetical protein [Haloechinothrix sp. LS1_15]MDV6014514.1 hypothetical protein [Haloechinothrix sp. LS1_15]
MSSELSPELFALNVASAVAASVAGAAWGKLTELPGLVTEALGRRRDKRTLESLLSDPDALAEVLGELIAEDPELADRFDEVLRQSRREAGGDVPEFPDPPPHATDREWERGELTRAIPQPVWRITGLRGSGKTTLALLSGHDQASRFPDGQVYIDLDRYRDGSDLARSEVAADILASLGIDREAIAFDSPRLWEQYRSVVNRRRFLLALDNARGVEEVRELSPTRPGSLAFVLTVHSDEALLAEYPHELPLRGIDRASGRRLLARYAGDGVVAADPQAVDELLDRCDDMPYAIIAVGVQLHRQARLHGPRAAGRVLAWLRDQGAGGAVEVIGRSLEETFRELPEHVVRACALLAEHPGTEVTTESAGVLLGTDPDGVLTELADAGLVSRVADGRLRLFNLVRDHASNRHGRAVRPEVDAGIARLLDHYRDRAAHADRLISPVRLRPYEALSPAAGTEPEPGFENGQHALRWLIGERFTLEALAAHAHRIGWDEHVVSLCGAAEQLVLNTEYHLRFVRMNTYGVSSAERLGRADLQARARGQQGRILSLLGDFGRAEGELRQALDLVGNLGDPELWSSTMENWGRHLQQRGYLTDAIGALRRCVEVDRTVGGHDGARAISIHARMLANMLLQSGELDEADRYLREATQAVLGHDLRNQSAIWTVRAKAELHARRIDSARSAIHYARELAWRAGTTQYEEQQALVLADVCVAEGDVDGARRLWGPIWQRYYHAGHPRAAELYARITAGA